jgi:four helix bundle protein
MLREASNAESSSDFIHKLSVALKEAGETQYWLELLFHSDYLNEVEFNSIYNDTDEVIKLLVSSIKTKKKNQIKMIGIGFFLAISIAYLMH